MLHSTRHLGITGAVCSERLDCVLLAASFEDLRFRVVECQTVRDSTRKSRRSTLVAVCHLERADERPMHVVYVFAIAGRGEAT
jgi:hypothetical protein